MHNLFSPPAHGLRAPATTVLSTALWLFCLSAPGVAREDRVELVDERAPFSATFDNLDGTQTLHYGVGPIHYKAAGTEQYELIDPTLIEEDGWLNETNSFTVRLPSILGGDDPIRLGFDGEIDWRPGRLYARLLSGSVVELGSPGLVWGEPSEETPNAIVYPNLYEGLDLEAEVRRGALNLFLRADEWPFPLAPEQIDVLYVEAAIELDPALLESVEQRAAEGEPYEQIPLHFGRADDEYVIALAGDPGVPDHQIADHPNELLKDPTGGSQTAPLGWRSNTIELLDRGLVQHFFRPTDLSEPLGVATSSAAALTATFRFEGRDSVDRRLFFNLSPLFGTGACESENPTRCKVSTNRLEAAKGDGAFLRAAIGFSGMKDLLSRVDNGEQITGISLGSREVYFLPRLGTVAIDTDSVVAYGALSHLEMDSKGQYVDPRKLPASLPRPYNQEIRSVPGGNVKINTWSLNASQPPVFRTIQGNLYVFGQLATKEPGASIPTAILDLRASLERFRAQPWFSLILANPFDRTTCTPCTANHPDPAVQALAGDFRVGAGFYDLRLEVRLAQTTQQQASILATSVGGHNDELFPGETLAWDLDLTSYSGPPDTVELAAVPWNAANGVQSWFTDPATGAVVDPPTLSSPGDKVRVHARWNHADASLYGSTKKLEIIVGFQGLGRSGGTVDIPITLKAPEGQPTFTQIYPVVDNNVSVPMGLASIQLPASGLRGATSATAELRWISGPTRRLRRGSEWDVWSWAFPGNDGEVVVYPDKLQAGTYVLELTPCLLPDTLTAVAPVVCSSSRAQQLTLVVRQASTPPPVPKPVIDLVSPWSLDDPTPGTVTVSVFGQDVGGGVSGTTVTIPQVLSSAPLSGSTASRVDVPANLSSGTLCGPRQLELRTAGGTDSRVFNVTKRFQNDPAHFAVETEAGILSGLSLQTSPSASGGSAVSLSGGAGDVTLRFRVPATSSDYRLYALYATSSRSRGRASVKLSGGSQSISYDATFAPTANGVFGLGAVTDQTMPQPTRFSLSAGTTYELRIESRTNQLFPILDMLILSDGQLPPTLAEICR